MGEGKVDILLKVSKVNLTRAEKRLDDGEYDSAVFHASIAAESAANAMIIELGGTEAKDHRAISALAAVLRRVKPELLRQKEFTQLIERGREVQREVVYSRYPLKIAGRWVSPMEYYTSEKARTAIDNAKIVVGHVKTYLQRETTVTKK